MDAYRDFIQERDNYHRLNNAAPDLLSACQYAYAMLHQHPDNQFAVLIETLRKAIEKAKPIINK